MSLLELPSGIVTGVALRDDVAYVAADTAGLLVFDLSDPLQPVLINAVAGDPDLDRHEQRKQT